MQVSSGTTQAKRVVPQASHPEAARIDVDGLPVVGTVLYPSQAFYNSQDEDTGVASWSRLRWWSIKPVAVCSITGIPLHEVAVVKLQPARQL